MYTCYAGDVFAVIAEPGNHEGVSYYLLRCTAERTKLYDPEESDGMLFPIGNFIHDYVYLGNLLFIKF